MLAAASRFHPWLRRLDSANLADEQLLWSAGQQPYGKTRFKGFDEIEHLRIQVRIGNIHSRRGTAKKAVELLPRSVDLSGGEIEL